MAQIFGKKTSDGQAKAIECTNSGALKVDVVTQAASNFEAITVSNAHAESLTALTYGNAKKALITVEGNSVRVRWDGTSPTTGIGHLCEVGTVLEITGDDIANFRAISIGTDAILSVTYSEES